MPVYFDRLPPGVRSGLAAHHGDLTAKRDAERIAYQAWISQLIERDAIRNGVEVRNQNKQIISDLKNKVKLPEIKEEKLNLNERKIVL